LKSVICKINLVLNPFARLDNFGVFGLVGTGKTFDRTYIASGAQFPQCPLGDTSANAFPFLDFLGYPIEVKPVVTPPRHGNARLINFLFLIPLLGFRLHRTLPIGTTSAAPPEIMACSRLAQSSSASRFSRSYACCT